MSGTGLHAPPQEETATIEHVQGLIAESRSSQPGWPNRIPPVDPAQALEDRMRALSLVRRQTQVVEYLPQRDWTKICVWTCRQKTLRSMCSALRHPPPEFEMQTFHSRTNGAVHRFLVVVPSNGRREAIAAAGRYSADKYLAREDAAAEVMKKLANDADVVVDDFNRDLLELEQYEHYAVRNQCYRLEARVESLTDSLHKWKMAACPEYIPDDTSSESD